MKSLILFFIFFGFGLDFLVAQVSNEKRIEISLRDGYSDETIYESSKGFFLLESIADKQVDGQQEIKYDLYNSNLALEKTETVLVPKGMSFLQSYSNDEFVYNSYSNKDDEHLIIGIGVSNLAISKTEFSVPKKATISKMKILGDYAYFVSYLKGVNSIFCAELSTGKTNNFQITLGADNPNYFPGIDNFQLLEASKEILYFPSTFSQHYMCVIKDDGTVETPVKLEGPDAKMLYNMAGHRVSENTILLTGGNGLGLFFGEVKDGELMYVKTHNYLEIENFLSFLPKKEAKMLEEQKAKAESRGQALAILYNIIDHNVIVLEDGYLLLGEAYYATTQSITYSNGTSTSTREVFDGYEYTHATLSKYSKEGDLMWNYCFRLSLGYKPSVARRCIAISSQTKNSINMVYSSGDSIFSKSVDFDGNVLNENRVKIASSDNESESSTHTYSRIDYWHDNYFLAYGSQVIKNGKEKRKVYFVNKIGF